MEGKILVVDDEKLTRATLEVQLTDEGFGVWTAPNGFQALEVLEREAIDLVVTDLRMPSMDGLEFQRIVRERWPDVAVVFMTAFGTVSTAVQAMREGASDYLTKPFQADELLIRIRRLVQRRRDIEEIRQLRADAARQRVVGKLVYRSDAMAQVIQRALSVADADVTVLIEGETGTGKEVLARAIHEHSSRSAAPFVAINCAGLNPNLVESELFGHEAGAFTGAVRQRQGRFEIANRGTLLIDEVDDLPPDIQVRLLRFLQDRTFERVGGNKLLRSDVRVLCATKRSLKELVGAGSFREDLFYRVNTVVVTLPPLRARTEDVVPLAEHFVSRFAAARGHDPRPELSPEVLRALVAYEWPGNVRELEHAVEHAVAFAHSGVIRVEHLPPGISHPGEREIVTLRLDGLGSVPYVDVVATCERRLIDWALSRTGGNQVRAAEMLQMSRTTFRGRLAAIKSTHLRPDAEELAVK